MKSYLLCCLFFLWAIPSFSQSKLLEDLEKLKMQLAGLSNLRFKDAGDFLLNDPGVYNDLWGRVYNKIREREERPVFKNLKLEFKTFQDNENNRASLGFAYHWNYDINSKSYTGEERSGFNSRIDLNGNVAFNKNLNPLDFQEAKLEFGRFAFVGGTVKKADSVQVAEMTQIKMELAEIEDEEELANSPLWEVLRSKMGIRNHFHYNLFASGGWEGSQDFSKSQFAYGAQVRFSAKAYDDKNALAQLNVLDYPFALIRYVTGTDKTITPYGATLPIISTGIEIVKPTADTTRQKLTSDEKQFVRYRFEVGFRTLVAIIREVPVHFNAAYRYFTEINAPKAVRDAGLNSFAYFTCSVTGADTYFVSYSYGNLPFDRTANAIYALGFKFNF